MNIKKIIFVFIILFYGMAHVVQSAQPMDELKGPVEQFIKILQDPQYSDTSKKDLQREKIVGNRQNNLRFYCNLQRNIDPFPLEKFYTQAAKKFHGCFYRIHWKHLF